MDWLLPAVIATLSSSLILTLVYYYLYRTDQERFLKIWAAAWLIYTVRFFCQLGLIRAGDSPLLLAGTHLAALASSCLLLWGSYVFLDRQLPRVWLYTAALHGIWIVIAISLHAPFLWLTLPPFLFQAVVYVWTGVHLLRTPALSGPGKQVTGWTFVLWGVHKADYPLLRTVTWFAPWGYLVGALLGLTVALGILLIYFEGTRSQLRVSKQRFQSILEAASSGIIVLDEQQKIVLFNEAAEEIFGYTRAEALGQPHDILLPNRFLASHRQQIAEFGAREKPGRFMHRQGVEDLVGCRQNGEEFPAEIAISTFEHDEQRFFVAVVNDITDRKQAEERLEQYVEELAGLREVDRAILSAEAPQTLAQSTLQRLQRLTRCQRASIALFDFDRQTYEMLAVQAEGKTSVDAKARGPLETFPHNMEKLRRAELLSVEDIEDLAAPSSVDQILYKEGIRSYINVPLMVNDEAFGTLNLGRREPGGFSEEQIDIARQVADSLAVAVHQARTLEAERSQRALAEALHETAAAISSSLDIGSVLDQILNNLGRVVPFDAADVMLLDPSQEIARIVRCQGYAQYAPEGAVLALEFPVADTPNLRQGLHTQGPVIVPDAQQSPGWVSVSETAWVRSNASVPIIHEEKVLGFLSINSAEPTFFTGEHTRRLKAFADQAAIAIQNARLYEELENYSGYLEHAVEERTAELRQTKERVETLVNHSPDAILLLGPDGTIEETNPAFCRMYGYSDDEAKGQSLTILASPEHIARIQKVLESVVQQPGPQQVELMARRCDGSGFDAQAVLGAVWEDDSLLNIVCNLRDITVLKGVERMKDEFLSTAAHELRTPLTSIQGFSEILLTRDLESQRQRRYLQTINEQATQLAQIINELLDISRMESGQDLGLSMETVQMDALAEEVIQPFIDICPNHRFRAEGLKGAPPVQADRFRLIQVLRNLVSNAVKYSPEGGTVALRGEVKANHLEVSIRDEGVGMTPEEQAHLFEKFYRARPSVTGGTGLGLTICKLIVEGHGGRIWVESGPGQGSSVFFSIPLAED